MLRTYQKGVTLIELIISIVVLSIAVTGVFSAIIQAARYSANPMTRQQAIIIAQSYMEEVLGRHFLDTGGAVCPATDITIYDRSAADNVCDYNNLYAAIEIPSDYRPRDIVGTLLPGLEEYEVNVTVTDDDASGAVLGTLVVLQGSAQQVVRVDVTVTTPDNFPVTLTAYRTNLP